MAEGSLVNAGSALVPLSAAERRVAVRHHRRLEVTWRSLGSQDNLFAPTKVQNLSRSGIGLLMEEEFHRGAILMIKLKGVPPRLARPILARVVRCRRQANAGWAVGCTLARRLS